jgi:MFS family permease
VGGLPRPFWVLWTGTLINRLGMFIEPFIALYLSSARHLPLAQVGGALTDRIGRRATLTAGMLANAAALLGLGYARGLAVLTVASIVITRAGLPPQAYGIAMAANGLVIVAAQPVTGS